jgi:hypothetical protein
LISFTRAATAELAKKVSDHPAAAAERPRTMHSFSISMLLGNPGTGHFPQPLRIADKWEDDEIVKRTLAHRINVRVTGCPAVVWRLPWLQKQPKSTAMRFLAACFLLLSLFSTPVGTESLVDMFLTDLSNDESDDAPSWLWRFVSFACLGGIEEVSSVTLSLCASYARIPDAHSIGNNTYAHALM